MLDQRLVAVKLAGSTAHVLVLLLAGLVVLLLRGRQRMASQVRVYRA